MGRQHANLINGTEGMQTVAVCDIDKDRLAVAREDLGDVKCYGSIAKLVKDPDVDLCVVVTPHNAHAKNALACLRAGKSVVVEKPMAIKLSECTAMIEAAKEKGVTLSVYHNRRYDGDFLAIKEVVEQGLIGEVFHIEQAHGGYGAPGNWWRADKKVSGGAFYDWGAHLLYWALELVPGKMKTVTGQFQKCVWTGTTNEDHCEAYVRFSSGATLLTMVSSLMAAGKDRWYILGTEGAVRDRWEGFIRVSKYIEGHTAEFTVKYKKSEAGNLYYENLAAHLLKGGENPVTAESARRVIAVIELAEKASKSGKEQPVPYE
jgi:predicted dehydrogenase